MGSTLTHDKTTIHAGHSVNRRQLLLGGTVLGAATLAGTGMAVAEDDQAVSGGPRGAPRG